MTGTQFARGAATGTETEAVTHHALDSARTQLDDPEQVQLAVVLSGPEYDAATIAEVIEESLGEIPLIGSTTAGEFTDEEVSEGGLVVALLASEEITVTTALSEGVSEDVFGTVQDTVDQLPDEQERHGEHTAAVTFHNGLAGKGEEITLVTSQVLGDVPLAGGSAGDNLALEETTVFTDAGASTDGVAIAFLESDKPFGLAADHGHKTLSETYEVTEADGNVVHELDGRPAFEVWKDEIREPAADEYGIDVDSVSTEDDEFAELLNQFELGLPTGDDSFKIRWPAMTDSTDGPLKFATGVPEGSEVRIMHSPKDDQIDSARAAAQQSLEHFGGTDVAGALVFDCVCRGLILGDDFGDAVDEIADELDAPLAGFETYGEISMPPEAASGYHNTTTSVLVIPK